MRLNDFCDGVILEAQHKVEHPLAERKGRGVPLKGSGKAGRDKEKGKGKRSAKNKRKSANVIPFISPHPLSLFSFLSLSYSLTLSLSLFTTGYMSHTIYSCHSFLHHPPIHLPEEGAAQTLSTLQLTPGHSFILPPFLASQAHAAVSANWAFLNGKAVPMVAAF